MTTINKLQKRLEQIGESKLIIEYNTWTEQFEVTFDNVVYYSRNYNNSLDNMLDKILSIDLAREY